MSRVFEAQLSIKTSGRGFTDVTRAVDDTIRKHGIQVGIVSVFCRHTSASLLIQENADSAVRRDLMAWLDRVAPEGAQYEHDEEGPDDMPAHIKTSLTRTSETMPVRQGAISLGTWQALYLVEHRRAGHTRTLAITLVGE